MLSKPHRLIQGCFARSLGALICVAVLSPLAMRVRADEPVQKLFNGKDLDGWRIIDEQDFKKHGAVAVSDGAIVIEAGKPASGIAWTGKPPTGEYEVSLQAKRLAGDDFFCGLTFPVGDGFATLIVGGWGGGVTGLSNINGMSAVENETTGFTEFKNDQWYAIKVRVTETNVSAWIDDDQIVDVERKGKRFAVWWEQEPARPLGIVTWSTKAAVREITLKTWKEE